MFWFIICCVLSSNKVIRPWFALAMAEHRVEIVDRVEISGRALRGWGPMGHGSLQCVQSAYCTAGLVCMCGKKSVCVYMCVFEG